MNSKFDKEILTGQIVDSNTEYLIENSFHNQYQKEIELENVRMGKEIINQDILRNNQDKMDVAEDGFLGRSKLFSKRQLHLGEISDLIMKLRRKKRPVESKKKFSTVDLKNSLTFNRILEIDMHKSINYKLVDISAEEEVFPCDEGDVNSRLVSQIELVESMLSVELVNPLGWKKRELKQLLWITNENIKKDSELKSWIGEDRLVNSAGLLVGIIASDAFIELDHRCFVNDLKEFVSMKCSIVYPEMVLNLDKTSDLCYAGEKIIDDTKFVNVFVKYDVIVRNVINLTKYIQGEDMLKGFEYEVDQIVDEKKIKEVMMFRIRCFSSDNDPWRSEDELNYCKEVFEKWRFNKKDSKKEDKVVLRKDIEKIVQNDKDLFYVLEIVNHKNKRTTLMFDVVYLEDNHKKRGWLNQGQIIKVCTKGKLTLFTKRFY